MGINLGALRFSTRLSIVSLLCASPLLGQAVYRGANPAAKGPEFDVSAGYSYAGVNFSGKPTVNMQGADLGAAIDFTSRWGATLDSSYVRAGRDPRTGHTSDVVSFLAGPVFVPAQNQNTRVLVRALAGVSVVDGSVPDSLVPVGQLYYRGWLTRFSWAVGTGIEHNISGPFAVRVNVDYLRTRYVSSSLTVQPQNNIRVTGSLVFRFAAPRHTPHHAARKR
jgi:opacity protein-like surface antigen